MANVNLDADLISKLEFIEKKDLRPGRYAFPDFLIVGPPRTGTTWLHRNLSFHPQIFMSSPKEIIFFDRLDKPGDAHFKSNRLEWYSEFFSISLSTQVNEILRNWRSFGAPYRIRTKGEATASYLIMEEAKINELRLLSPEIKIIISVRNPVDRAWSDLKKHLASRQAVELHFESKSFDDIDFETFARFYNTNYMMRCGQFTANIARWKRIFWKDQVLLYAFDDIAERPRALLEDIYRFLGISTRDCVFNADLYSKVVHRITDLEMPEEHKHFLSDMFREEIQSLNQAFGLSFI
jgi:hypothetical protein